MKKTKYNLSIELASRRPSPKKRKRRFYLMLKSLHLFIIVGMISTMVWSPQASAQTFQINFDGNKTPPSTYSLAYYSTYFSVNTPITGLQTLKINLVGHTYRNSQTPDKGDRGYQTPFKAYVVDVNGKSSAILSQEVSVSRMSNSNTETLEYVFDVSQMAGIEYLFVAYSGKGSNRVDGTPYAVFDDNTAPTMPVIHTSADQYAATQTVQIDGSTDDTFVSRYEYSLDGANYSTYQNPLVFNTTGTYTVYARAVDTVNNYSAVSSKTILVDSMPPGQVAIALSDTAWSKDDVKVSMTANATGPSGISKIRYGYDSFDSGDVPGASTSTIVTKEGVTTVHAKAYSGSGVEGSESTAEVKIDKTAPEATLTVPPDWSQSATITAKGADSLSGMKYIELPSGERVASDRAEYTVPGNGTYTFRFADIAGNIREKSITINSVDKQVPTVTVSQDGSEWTDQAISVKYTFADIGSGLDNNRLYYKVTSTSDEPKSWDQASGSEQTITFQDEGIWYLHLKGYDYAKNEVTFVSKPYRIQHKPTLPEVKVKGTGAGKMMISYTLPGAESETDGYVYQIHNQTTGKSWTVSYPTNFILDDSLEDGAYYSYTVKALNHVGESEVSSAITGVTLPAATTQATIKTVEDDYSKAKVTILPVSSATSYRIVAQNMSTNHIQAETVTSNTYETLLSGFEAYAMYDIAIYSTNESGEGPAYHTSFLSLPDVVTGFTSAQVTEHSIGLTWNTATRDTYNWSSVSEDTYYQLDRNHTHIFNGVLTQYLDDQLDAGTSYDYAVAAGNSSGFGTKAYLSGLWTLPEAVTGFRQTSATDSTITLHWQAPRGVTGYRVFYDTYEVGINESEHEWTFSGFSPGTTKEFTIYPKNASGYGQAVTVLGTTLPSKPTASSVHVESVGEDEATFFIEPSPGADKYHLVIGGTDYTIGSGRFVVHGLKGGQRYTYTFASENSAGRGESLQGTLQTVPASVQGFIVKAHSPISLDLTWKAVEGAEAYRIYDSEGHLLSSIQASSYHTSSLQPGSWNKIIVRASNAVGESKPTSFIWRAIPGFENEESIDWSKLVMVTRTDMHEATLEWKAVPGADGYRIYDADHQLLLSTTELQATIHSLESATAYSNYTVVPFNDAGEGTKMNVPTFVTKPSNDYKLSYDSDRNSVTIHIDHSANTGTLVVASQGKELFRGPIQDIKDYVVDRLQPGSTYTFEIWMENELNERSEPQILEARTSREKAPKVEEIVATMIQEPTNAQTVDQQPSEETTIVSKSIHFVDIDRSFAKEAITRLAEQGIIQGVDEDHFAPEQGTTRAEFMAMLTRLLLNNDQIQKAQNQSLTFSDIDRSGWYVTEMKAAVQYGIAQGFSSKEFRPDEEINREQAVKMVANVVYRLAPEDMKENSYVDSNMISTWAKSSVNALSAANLILGYPDQTFRPQIKLTRAETATLIDRLTNLKK